MKIDLFDHNKTAYEAAVELLNSEGKAAIVHPTGTGKSFIGFQLCADHPDENVLWLSPSKYIFDTQLENLARTTDGELPDNITFLTYARLMMMDEAEVDELRPAWIILDEFHCCGARMWGQGVQTLLRKYPKVPVLGLSATNIRYLDNQRDMAAELFDGNIASEITLGEAIVRGILNPPKYVMSIYKYQQDLQRYEARIRSSRNKAVRDEGERYLEALKRALEKADGLDDIFDRHMTDRTGKYIVFCANKEHMDEMMGHLEWFAKVDRHPHVYSLYSADPSTSREIDDFKTDEDDTHLRLLYCIDALNQGIHVDDVSGVILLRPTVSPIVYKQQIGRALSASRKKDAVIFDIVLNIENLYSIGAIEEEMELATCYYRELGESSAIVNEHFKIIDEVRDCLELFDRLNDVLGASWDLMYGKAADYYQENGDLEVPRRYVTADGYALGNWINNQRATRSGTIQGRLTEEQIGKLSAIGMVWENRYDLAWAKNYAAAERYYKEHGDLNCPYDYVTPEGVNLGEWLRNLRRWRNAGAHQTYLTPERAEALNAIGMVWDKTDYYWECNYQLARNYYREHGNLDVPYNYVTEDGVRLGNWIYRLRAARSGRDTEENTQNPKKNGMQLTEDRIRRLDEIGMIWEDRNELLWDRYFDLVSQYYREHGNLDMPQKYETDGVRLGVWLNRQKVEYRAGRLSPRRTQRMESLGVKAAVVGWEDRVALAKRYLKEQNAGYIPQDAVIDGVWIGKWLAAQRKALEAGLLTPAQKKMLEGVPLWTKSEMQWESAYALAEEYYRSHGHLDIPRRYVAANGYGLGSWISYQKKQRSRGKLSERQIRKLDEIGFRWDET
ncbi:MAG: Helicase associated domain protein [Lachnospiraceae bacterium]|nr:Helicase associated domain protein [Lachnospiraceae bacterium]